MAGMKRVVVEAQDLSRKKARQDGSTGTTRVSTPQSSVFSDEDASVPETTSTWPSTSRRPKKYVCSYDGCIKAFDRPVRLEAHVRTHTNERPFSCKSEGCDKAFFKVEHLKAHIQNKHNDSPDYICAYVLCVDEQDGEKRCGKAFTTSSRLKRHLAVHEKMEDMKCDECGQTFRKMETLQRHIRQDHLHEKAFICSHPLLRTIEEGDDVEDECGEAFATVSQLKSHENREHGGNRYFCEICYPPRPSMAMVDDIDAAMADIDRPGFKTWAELQAHNKQVHPPTCLACGKICVSNRDLTAHMDIQHSSADRRQKFPCTHPGCDRSFTKKGNLAVHVQTVHGKIKRFVCGQFDLGDALSKGKISGWTNDMGCGAAFSTKASLEGHVATQHLDLPPLRKKAKSREKVKVEDVDMADSSMDVEWATQPETNLAQLSQLTGHGYAEFRTLACPISQCVHRFTREYDLQQHLRSKHERTDQSESLFAEDSDRFWIGGFDDEADDEAMDEAMFITPDADYCQTHPGAVNTGNIPWLPPTLQQAGDSMLLDPALVQL